MSEERLDSFPFDSKFAGYDDYGYPVYDRAVGAYMLRETFKQYFSDGIFGKPATAFEITKGDGLSVTVGSGLFIINGAMGYVKDGTRIVLEESAPQGKFAHGLYLRYDENADKRSCYLISRKGSAGTDPLPPEPESGVGYKELRIGYVVIPSSAEDMSSAEIHSEKGLDVCPYAAPFAEIDVSEIVGDVKQKADAIIAWFEANMHSEEARANQRVDELEQEIRENLTLLETAIDGTTAGHLQNQIDQIDAPGILSDVDIDEIWGESYPPGQ